MNLTTNYWTCVLTHDHLTAVQSDWDASYAPRARSQCTTPDSWMPQHKKFDISAQLFKQTSKHWLMSSANYHYRFTAKMYSHNATAVFSCQPFPEQWKPTVSITTSTRRQLEDIGCLDWYNKIFIKHELETDNKMEALRTFHSQYSHSL